MTQEKYAFSYECGDTRVELRVGQGLDVHEMCAQFENFLLATGYRLREHESVGVVDEMESVAPDNGPDADEEDLNTIGRYLEGVAGDVGHGSTLKFDGANAWADQIALRTDGEERFRI